MNRVIFQKTIEVYSGVTLKCFPFLWWICDHVNRYIWIFTDIGLSLSSIATDAQFFGANSCICDRILEEISPIQTYMRISEEHTPEEVSV